MPRFWRPNPAWLTPFPAARAAQNGHACWPHRPLRAGRAARPSAPPIASCGPKSAGFRPKSAKTAHCLSRRAPQVTCGPALRQTRSPTHPRPDLHTESKVRRWKLSYSTSRWLPGAPEAGAAERLSFCHDIRLAVFGGDLDATFSQRGRAQIPVQPTLLNLKKKTERLTSVFFFVVFFSVAAY